jgi:alkanesulfonate monooxygenase SsuD/methylene tetrahydromethanopterin reductase-like flavin-dependent oxidoreductase (luciferase family)
MAAPVPVWIAALGPRATRLAGQIADGVILNWCTPDRVGEARDAIRASAEAAGRDPAAVTIAVYVRAAFSDRADEALLAAAGEYASYPSYARQFRVMGIEPTAEAVVEAICLRGDLSRARDRLDAYREAGADLPVVYPVLASGERAEDSIRVLSALSPGLSEAAPALDFTRSAPWKWGK